jgi:hypothetical protein
MKKISIYTLTFLVILIASHVYSRVYGQSMTNTVDPLKDEISQEDLKAVLSLLHINLFKFNTNFPFEQKCTVFLYQQEYEKRKLIKEFTIWGTSNPFQDRRDGKNIEKALDYIRIITKIEDQNFWLGIRMGDFELNEYHVKIDTIYKNPHACKPFKLPLKYNIGDKVPLLLIGSFWDSTSKDGKMKVQRFCMENEMLSDFSSKAFDEMPHYFVFGIKIEPAQ